MFIYKMIALSVFLRFYFMNHLTNFHETWYEGYATGGHTNDINICFLYTVITWWMRKSCDMGVTLAPLTLWS